MEPRTAARRSRQVEVVLAIGLALAGLLIIDRLFEVGQRRRARKDPDGSNPLSAAIMDFDGFLNPARRHEIDEKRRQELLRDEVAPSDPRFTQINLDSGMAVIRLPGDPNQPTGSEPPTWDRPSFPAPNDRSLGAKPRHAERDTP